MARKLADKARRGISRRTALIVAGAGALAGCTTRAATIESTPPGPGLPFQHGVASGDPLQDRVVLWTRVTTTGAGPVDVRWMIGRDPELADLIVEGRATAEPMRDFTVKVDAEGLEPGQTCFYGFEALGARSPVGRTRTLPAGATPAFKVAVVACANHPAGWFNVYRDIADRSDADLVLHLGDYIYEYGPGGYGADWGAKHGRIPDPPHELLTLADYRRRHAQYKADPDLQAAHAAAPWIMTWDDHETANNANVGGAENHQDGEGGWSERKAAAVQAYLEWNPVREPAPGRARDMLWRRFEIGDLATLVMLETRLTARSPAISWDDCPVPHTADPEDPQARAGVDAFLRDVVGADDRQMLGRAQEDFVQAALADSVAAGKPWRILGNQTIMAPVASPNYLAAAPRWLRLAIRLRERRSYALMRRSPFSVPLNLDQWDGYPAARERLYAAARRAGSPLVVLSGDSHTFMVNALSSADGTPVGVELGTTSAAGPGPFDPIPDVGVDFGALTEGANPHVLHHNCENRGYVALTLTPEAIRAELRRVDTVTSRTFAAETYKRYEITRAGEALNIAEVGSTA